jgi:hypothetical protein
MGALIQQRNYAKLSSYHVHSEKKNLGHSDVPGGKQSYRNSMGINILVIPDFSPLKAG